MSTKAVMTARHRHARTAPGRHASANTSPIVNTGGWAAEQMSFTASFFDKPVMYRLKGMKACCGLCSRPFERPFSTIAVDRDPEPADIVTHADHGLIVEAGQHAAVCPALPDLFESAFIEELGLTPEQVRVLEPEARRALLDHYWETSPAVLTAPVLWDRKL